MVRQHELIERVKSYDPNVNESILNRAYVFAMKAHGSQLRASGDPYFSHPIEVAAILAGMRLDVGTIVTALLHDVIEDTVYSRDDIATMFGDEIAGLVDGVSKLSQIELQPGQSSQAENFRKLILAMSDDIRVLLVKLADRLHNMRTLSYVADPEKRRRIALETQDIYAPLAERMGIHNIRDELEGLAFYELHPDEHESITRRLSSLRAEGHDHVARIIAELKDNLANAHIIARVSGREKKAYSIWRKMENKAVAFEQLSDIIAFRVVVDSIEICYRVLGLLHTSYSVIPGRFKDYISTPKPNGYRSLHTALIGPFKTRIEIQIRTGEMDEVAERGVAAHWIYKQGTSGREGRRYRWMRELLDIMENAFGAEEFLEHTKMSMYSDQVFPFTPKGDVIALPHGATLVDFAYAVHTDIGDTCVGAKINGRLVPLTTEIRNGDQVEIVRSTQPSINPSWENFVVTGKARSCIRRYIRVRQRQEFIDLGRSILSQTFASENQDFSEKALESVLETFACDGLDDLYVAIGSGELMSMQVLVAMIPDHKIAHMDSHKDGKNSVVLAETSHDQGSIDAVLVRGLTPGIAVHYGSCCNPLPGDKIIGIMAVGKGVTIHRVDCHYVSPDMSDCERMVRVSWGACDGQKGFFVGRLSIVLANNVGSLGFLSTIIGKHDSNITNLKITNRSPDFFDMMVDLEVRDLPHLSHIMKAIKDTPAVHSVERPRGSSFV